jgi:hypothetical protein
LEAIKESDLVICLIDKRYGGYYAGKILDKPFNPIQFKIKGYSENGEKKSFNLKYPLKKLSITWCEIFVAYEKGIPVITFARQRILDEKETRRRNQYLKNFSPAYSEKNEIFDLLDWISQRQVNNWIAPFISIVDFEKKLDTWMSEINRSIPKSEGFDNKQNINEDIRICILVEAELDRLFVSYLLQHLNLKLHFVIIPVYGKYHLLNNFDKNINPYSKIFKEIIILLDSDSYTEEEYNSNKMQVNELIERNKHTNVSAFFANPSIETWLAAGINQNIYNEYNGKIDKNIFIKRFKINSIKQLDILLNKDFSFDNAINLNKELHIFTEKLISLENSRYNV